MKPLLILTTLLFLTSALYSQDNFHQDPNDVEFITSDIENFWKAFDRAKGKSRGEQLKIYREEYINQATTGFKSYIDNRNKTVEQLVDGVNSLLPFYESIRADMLTTEDYKKVIKSSFYAFKYLYPEAVFPDIYFFVWVLGSSGSTVSDEGLLMSMDVHSINENSPLDKLPAVQREIFRTLTIENMPLTVAHELIHFQQPGKGSENSSLLDRAFREGSADFIAELISGQNPTMGIFLYADSREKELWREFKQKMHGKDYKSGWTGIPKDRPVGLPYWMGYKIVKAYYDKQPDKKRAIREIIESEDPERILEESRYSNKFE